MNELLNKLNTQQREAVEHINGPLLVLAGAGSGKTRVLTSRIAYMINNANVSPWNILAITFTNKAAREMQQRIEALVGSAANDMWVRTFHSACVRILRRDIDRLGYSAGFNIIDSDDQKSLVKECLKEIGFEEKQFPPRSVMSEISFAKDNLLSPEEYLADYADDYRKKQIARIYMLYQKKLKTANDLDFDDLIMLTVRLLRENEDVLEFYRNKFKFILVDEYQDTNKAQNELIILLAGQHRNLCVVGDDDQSIYKFRGADISNILDFEKAFPESTTIRLEQNYRSTQNILDAANNVIRNNSGRKGKKLWTDKGEGAKISVYKAANEHDEASFIADTMSALAREGYSYNDMAVLYRANASSRALEEVFMRKAVPYRVLSGLRFYDRKEIRDMIAYLRLIKNPDDNISLKRIINTPSRKIGKVTLDKITAAAERENCSLLKAIGMYRENLGASVNEFYDMITYLQNYVQTNTVSDLVNEVFEKTGYREFLETDEKGEDRIDNVYELINGAGNYIQENEDATFQDYMDNLALISDIDNYDEDLDAAIFMTMHSAKGLEFPIVFICGFDEGIFPNSMSSFSGEELEEERRLCYVGITRAQEMLHITCARSRMLYGKTSVYKPSRFLDEIPAELLDITDNTPKMNDRWFPKAEHITSSAAPQSSLLSYGAPSVKTNTESFRPGDSVMHKKFGRGIVIDATPVGNDIHYEIAFESVGTKNLLGLYAKLQRCD